MKLKDSDIIVCKAANEGRCEGRCPGNDTDCAVALSRRVDHLLEEFGWITRSNVEWWFKLKKICPSVKDSYVIIL